MIFAFLRFTELSHLLYNTITMQSLSKKGSHASLFEADRCAGSWLDNETTCIRTQGGTSMPVSPAPSRCRLCGRMSSCWTLSREDRTVRLRFSAFHSPFAMRSFEKRSVRSDAADLQRCNHLSLASAQSRSRNSSEKWSEGAFQSLLVFVLHPPPPSLFIATSAAVAPTAHVTAGLHRRQTQPQSALETAARHGASCFYRVTLLFKQIKDLP